MATLKDVAKLAMVDVSTVSRALNNTSYVHPDTKARIMAAVEKLSYKPNLLAKGLRQGKRHTIGVVVPGLHLTVFSTIAQAIEKTARDKGYSTLICSTEDDPKIEKDGLNRLRNGLVDAIIIAGTGRNNRLLRDIHASGIAITQVIRLQDKNLSSVTVDYRECGFEAAQFLYNQGCRHIGLISGSLKIAPYKLRYDGYKDFLTSHDLEEITAISEGFSNSLQYGYECTKQLLQTHPNLDAIMAAVDAQGIGALRALRENEKTSHDVRLISLTGHDIGNMLETTMTSMEMPAQDIGCKAALLAIEEIEANKDTAFSAQHIIFNSSLVCRESTPTPTYNHADR